MQPFEQSRRAPVGGGNGRWLALVALLGAGLLILMVAIGTIDAPPAPTATPLLVAPGPSPAATQRVPATATPASWPDELLYLVRGPRAGAPTAIDRRSLEVIDPASGRTAYTAEDVSDAALSADGRTLYVLGSSQVAALDAATGAERWRVPLIGPLDHAIEIGSGSRLALSADGASVLVLRQQIEGRLGLQQAWIERHDSATGAVVGRRLDVDPLAWNPALLAGGPGAALLASPAGLSAIDLGGGPAIPLMGRDSGPFVMALAPRQNQIYVANGDGVLTTMSRFDPSFLRRSALLPADTRPSFGADTLAASPNGELVALVLERTGRPIVYAGSLTREGVPPSLVAINPNTGTIVREAALPPDGWITHLTFSGDGTLVYFQAGSRLYRWHLESNAVSQVATLGDRGLERLVAGPALPAPAPTPTAVTGATPTPRPLPPPLTRPLTETVAWLWPVRGAESDASVVAYAADGSARLVAGDVDTVVKRPGRMPLLLRQTGQREWQISDPGAQVTATVRFSAPPQPLLYWDWHTGFLPSPDGQTIAFLANADLIDTDALTASGQIVLVDVRSGELRALAGLPGLQEQLDWPSAQWADDGIYVFGQSPAAATVRSATSLWHIDPASAEPALARVMGFATPGAYASLNIAAGLVLYQPHTADPYSSTLRLAALGGAETVVMERGPFINSFSASISPDGRYVAYLRPDADLEATDLVLYEVAARRETRLLGGLRRTSVGEIYWSGRSRLHLLRSDQQPWLGVSADDVWELGDLVPTRPQRRLSPAWPWQHGFSVEPDWFARRRFARLDTLEGHALLRRISLDPSPSVDVSLPLPAWPAPDPAITDETLLIYQP